MGRNAPGSLPVLPPLRRGGVARACFVLLALTLAACAGGFRTGGPAATISSAALGARHHDTVPAARLIFVGDTGTGDGRAAGVAEQIRQLSDAVPVSHVFLLGDNVYGYRNPASIYERFLDVYRGVLAGGVRFHAALGNHDLDFCADSGLRPVPRDETAYELAPRCSVRSQLQTPQLGFRDGFRYYSAELEEQPPGWRRDAAEVQDLRRAQEPPLVEVFVVDSNTLGRKQTRLAQETDEPQLGWLAEALQQSGARWKIVAMHHPIYAPVRCRWFRLRCRGADEVLRAELEPIFRENGVDIVFQAHQHLYARLLPQHGIRYFVTGAGGRRADSFRSDEDTVPRDDRGAFNHFVYVRVTDDQFDYCVVDADGEIRDGGSFTRGEVRDRQIDPCSVPGNVGPTLP